MVIKLIIGNVIVTILSVYVPQLGLDDKVKDAFYDDLLSVVSKVSDQEHHGHIGGDSAGFHGIHSGYGFGERNPEGVRILEFAVAHGLVVGNSFFKKKDDHLITYQSGSIRSQIDYILLRKRDFKLAKDVKVIPGEECTLQHRLLICNLRLLYSEPRSQPFVSKRRIWKLNDPDCKVECSRLFDKKLSSAETGGAGGNLESTENSLLSATEEVCCWTKKRPLRKQTWWWSDDVSAVVSLKRKLWKA